MAAAPIDRLVHHCHIVNIRGNSTGSYSTPSSRAVSGTAPLAPGLATETSGGYGGAVGLTPHSVFRFRPVLTVGVTLEPVRESLGPNSVQVARRGKYLSQ